MTDLVHVVTARLMYAVPQDGGDRRTKDERREDFEGLARAAIATVLDDLAPVTEEMVAAYAKAQEFRWPEATAEEVWAAMLTAKRKELGLASPAAPGDAP